MNNILLNDGNALPVIGFGVYKIGEAQMESAIRTAYEAGYRLFDTASFYKNEESLGHALKKLAVARGEVCIATKAWTDELGFDGVQNALKRSLKRLGTDYIDTYLIHWPIRSEDKLRETWAGMEKLKDEGLARSIAVSNFEPHHLEAIAKDARYLPAVNQLERHPLLTQKEPLSYCAQKGIAVEAWSPLMRGKSVMELENIRCLAAKYHKTPAQIILRWDVQQGVVPIPKSVTPDRIRENLDLFDFTLSEEDMLTIDALNRDERSGAHPDSYRFESI